MVVHYHAVVLVKSHNGKSFIVGLWGRVYNTNEPLCNELQTERK